MAGARSKAPLRRGFFSAERMRTVGKTPACSRRRVVRCDSIPAALVFPVAWQVPQWLKPAVPWDRNGPAEAGPFKATLLTICGNINYPYQCLQ